MHMQLRQARFRHCVRREAIPSHVIDALCIASLRSQGRVALRFA